MPAISRPPSDLRTDRLRVRKTALRTASDCSFTLSKLGSGDSGQVSQQLAAHLQKERHLLIFPEGTTTDGTALRTFHGRLLSSAIDSGVPLQPVAIRYLRDGQPCPIAPWVGDDGMLDHLLRMLSSDIAEVEIRLLSPLSSQDSSRNQLARQAQEAIAQALYDDLQDLRQSA